MDIKLSTVDFDLDVTNGNVTLVSDYDAIAQHLSIRLQTFLGEWFLDSQIGVPYFEEIFIKNPNKLVVETRFRQVIEGTPGIDSIVGFNYNFNGSTRALSVSFEAKLTTGSTESFEFTELILPVSLF